MTIVPPQPSKAIKADSLPAVPVLEDETHHLLVNDDLETRLATIHRSVSRTRHDGALEGPIEPEPLVVCSDCSEEVEALGLPYRVVIRCSHA